MAWPVVRGDWYLVVLCFYLPLAFLCSTHHHPPITPYRSWSTTFNHIAVVCVVNGIVGNSLSKITDYGTVSLPNFCSSLCEFDQSARIFCLTVWQSFPFSEMVRKKNICKTGQCGSSQTVNQAKGQMVRGVQGEFRVGLCISGFATSSFLAWKIAEQPLLTD